MANAPAGQNSEPRSGGGRAARRKGRLASRARTASSSIGVDYLEGSVFHTATISGKL